MAKFYIYNNETLEIATVVSVCDNTYEKHEGNIVSLQKEYDIFNIDTDYTAISCTLYNELIETTKTNYIEI